MEEEQVMLTLGYVVQRAKSLRTTLAASSLRVSAHPDVLSAFAEACDVVDRVVNVCERTMTELAAPAHPNTWG